MENISSPKYFLQQENLNTLSQLVNNIFIEREFNLARKVKIKLVHFLEKYKSYEKDFQSSFILIQNLLIKLKFFTLSSMPLDELIIFFEKHWIEQYDIPDYIGEKFSTLNNFFEIILLSLPYDERDQYKMAVIKALKNNKQTLFEGHTTNKKITVSSLLLDFDATFQENKSDTLLFLKYIDLITIKNNFKEADKEKIRHLFNFYKLLSTSSMTEQGAEEIFIFQDEGDNILKVFKKGVIEELKDKNIKKIVHDIFETYGDEVQKQIATDFSNKLLNSYKLSKINEYDIYKKLKNWPAIHTKEFEKIFHLGINKRELVSIIVSLYKLAKDGYLDEIFERDIKIKEIFKAHLAKKFTEKLAAHFEQNLREPVYLSYFLQHILKDILKLDENESAVLAIKLVNELKRAGDKQYLPIAYGDLKEGIFKWKGIVEKDDKLELEK